MITIPVGVTKTTNLLRRSPYEDLSMQRTYEIYPTDYIWRAIPQVGSPFGTMRNTRPVANLIFVKQGGIGLIAQAPTIGQVWPRGNPEVTSD